MIESSEESITVEFVMGSKYLNLLEPKVFAMIAAMDTIHLTAKDSTEEICNTSISIKTPENRG
jgi:hypothetical protein